ncbi:MAG: pyridoxamine 5'-phosphate oxidase [Brumimicrobium sp.]|nr:pyridoxamine 5'-phosphate oxidase [Brumimicrobium sp.]
MEEFIDKLRNDHSDFDKGRLEDEIKSVDPMLLFKKWYKEAFENNCAEPHAMVLSTVGKDLQPSSRTVYLKELLEEGIIFYTNYESHKAQEMEENPKVSILFYWDCLERQIRIQGRAERAPKELSDDYFASRPRESQLGAWASAQSRSIKNREELENNLKTVTEKFEGKNVPRPPFWGGYLIRPDYIEFWQGRPKRLHDRICFVLNNNGKWDVHRKNP